MSVVEQSLPTRDLAVSCKAIVSLVLTDRPWDLQVDALVIPASAEGHLTGSLANSLREAVGIGWAAIEEAVGRELKKVGNFGPDHSVGIPVSERAIRAKHLVVATAFRPGRPTPGLAAGQALQVAAGLSAHSIAIPLLGAGSGGQESYSTASEILTSIEKIADGVGVFSVFLYVKSQSDFVIVSRLRPSLETSSGVVPPLFDVDPGLFDFAPPVPEPSLLTDTEHGSGIRETYSGAPGQLLDEEVKPAGSTPSRSSYVSGVAGYSSEFCRVGGAGLIGDN